jgi:streptogramin lyase
MSDANPNTVTLDRQGVLWFTGQSGIYGRLDPNGTMAVAVATAASPMSLIECCGVQSQASGSSTFSRSTARRTQAENKW